MKKTVKLSLLMSSSVAALSAGAMAADGGFIADSTATLTARNYYFSRDYSDIVGNKAAQQKSKAEEWAQGFILNYKSGYTQGTVGFGLDAIGLLGIKLDSSPDRVNTGLLPVPTKLGDKAPNDYGRVGAALKVKVSKTELKVGELMPNLPVLAFSDIRLLPPTYQGASITSAEIAGLNLQAGQLRSSHMRNEGGDEKMSAMIGYRPNLSASSDRFNYAGADYSFNDNRTTASAWYAQLKDIYNQRFFGLKHSQPVSDWVLGANLGFYDAGEDGKHLIGKVDNQAFFSLLSAKRGGHTFYVGYQAMYGDTGFARVFANVAPLGNEVPTFEFASADERSWQLRYDYDFAALGLPGLSSTVRYLRGDNVDAQSANGGGPRYEGKDWERDLDLAYIVQSGPLKNFSVRIRNVTARSNYRTDVDENRLILSYTISLF